MKVLNLIKCIFYTIFLTVFLPHSSFCCIEELSEYQDNTFNELPVAKIAPSTLSQFQSEINKQLDYSATQFWNSVGTKRKTIEYGYGFQRMVEGDFSYKNPPQFLEDLGNAVCDSLNEPRESFTNFIISLYEPGFQIEPHYDTDENHLKDYGFYFEEKVFGVVIQPDPTGSLYLAYYEGDSTPPIDIKPRFPVNEQEGTSYVLKGKYRYKPFYHGVSEVSHQRISVTFRKSEV